MSYLIEESYTQKRRRNLRGWEANQMTYLADVFVLLIELNVSLQGYK
jgi:hypothetical protein